MWLTTSKHADAKTKKAGRQMADALPDASFVPRGEQALERLQELARREAQETILVASRADGEGTDGKAPVLFVLRARQRAEGAWSWNQEEMEVKKMEAAGPGREGGAGGEPYRIQARSGEEKKLAAFLGLRDEALAAYYDEPAAVLVEAGRAGTGVISRDGAECLTLHYAWRAGGGKS